MDPSRLDPPSTPAAPDERLALTVAQLTRGWMRLGREEARALGLSLSQLFLLGALRETGPIPVSRWVEMVGISPSATTSLLDGLESEGYILRVHDRQDRRQVLVSLTPKGRQLANRLRGEFRRKWKTFCEEIPAAELEAAASTLDQLVARMAHGNLPRPPVAATTHGPRRRA